MKKINLNILLFFLLIILPTYIFEVIYYLPSPTGDGVEFLKRSFSFCRHNTLTLNSSHDGGEVYVSHGWFPWYLKSILNFNCQFGFIFLFNFLLKLITIFFSFLFLKDKIYKNYLLIILFFIFVIQLKLQFRPENFVLMLTSIIFYLNDRKFYKFIPIFFGILFNTHLVFFGFLALFFMIYFHKTYFKFKIYIESIVIFICAIFILDIIYPHNLINYLQGNIFQNSGTWTKGSSVDIWSNFIDYYLITKIHGGGFFPLFGIIFFLTILILAKENKLFFFAIPFLYFFSLRNMPGNYYMVCLTPILLILSINFDKKKYFKKSKAINALFLFILFVTITGYSQYFVKNILTIKYFKNDYENTLSFIDNNLDKIDRLPSFAYLVNDKIKLQKYEVKGCHNCNKSNSKKRYNVIEANGNINPCPDSNLNNKDFSIKLFKKKIFNSNSSYGIYICRIN